MAADSLARLRAELAALEAQGAPSMPDFGAAAKPGPSGLSGSFDIEKIRKLKEEHAANLRMLEAMYRESMEQAGGVEGGAGSQAPACAPTLSGSEPSRALGGWAAAGSCAAALESCAATAGLPARQNFARPLLPAGTDSVETLDGSLPRRQWGKKVDCLK